MVARCCNTLRCASGRAIARLAFVPVLMWLAVTTPRAAQSGPPDSSGHVPILAGSFPRFPHDVGARTQRRLAVLYTPDDLSATSTWAGIGYPDGGLFQIHGAHPQLKITVQVVAENRYIADSAIRNVVSNPFGAALWRDLQTKPEFGSWLELGNHGFQHSPDGDPDLNHHEFDGAISASARDLAYCRLAFENARKAYRQIGLDNAKIIVLRFPGYKFTAAALTAARENGFLAFFFPRGKGEEVFYSLDGSKEMLVIPDLSLPWDADDPELVRGIKAGAITSASLSRSEPYRRMLLAFEQEIERRIASGGIVNFFDHWWEHGGYNLNGVPYRFRLFSDGISYVIGKYGSRVWWPFASDLAQWLEFRKHADVGITGDERETRVQFKAPPDWNPDWTLEASYSLVRSNGVRRLPPVSEVSMALSSDPASWHVIPPGHYWTDAAGIHITFRFTGDMTIRIRH